MFMFIGMYNILLVRHVLFDLLLFQLIQMSVCVCAPPQATMLKKMKGKMKRRNTEPTMLVSPGAQLAPLPSNDGESPTDPTNTTF
ncbi:hypothetical protein BDFB_005345 [Asbolus verrucosus]|uniref:Secreted protein n=1 Tax=Asbolus verrucosus TaxID=1661398 RepID=A0A482VA09_ASBVE|nr:hypothetical protein BDFB_005345 [Asbolus verrucosus]